ncbi:hypothetical protein [Trichormus azollae]|nr:hypothetical protein [Trichormus azollae]
MKQLTNHPLWSRLQAVQQNRVIQLKVISGLAHGALLALIKF